MSCLRCILGLPDACESYVSASPPVSRHGLSLLLQRRVSDKAVKYRHTNHLTDLCIGIDRLLTSLVFEIEPQPLEEGNINPGLSHVL